MSSHGKKKWAGACNYNSLTCYIEATFYQCLKATRPEDTGQRPTGKRQKSLPGSSGYHKMIPCVSFHCVCRGAFNRCTKNTLLRGIDNTAPHKHFSAR
ncbi:hypothetical protein GCM10011585_09750 [Edaphobacter dinghuensis]|uniref:Uncharacterized protein n=1 Tax=Edaphobacter dinghuensis TaxID=1560005 RepID=A0A917M0D7_9BACT|nr:hypothetical protein GCM10011585_09750 [Edaphobacter dinghuensis]